MALNRYGSSSQFASHTPVGITEFDILKASHKFLREDNDKAQTWDDQLAEKYYASLYREFAVCDLKHFKSGNFALRWRTEEEVLSGAGETTCGNTRCEYHEPPSAARSTKEGRKPTLTTLELPFAYMEHGENKSALVKIVLCGRCLRKLMWKRNKEKQRATAVVSGEGYGLDEHLEAKVEDEDGIGVEQSHEQQEHERKRKKRESFTTSSKRPRSSRSRSPREPKPTSIERRQSPESHNKR